MLALNGTVANSVTGVDTMLEEASVGRQIFEAVQTAFGQWQIKGTCAAIGGWYSSVSAGDALLLVYVFVLMGVDLIFGVIEARHFGEYSPYRFCRGMIKIGTYAATIVLVMLLAGSVNASIGVNLHLQDFFMAYLVACEAISIIRHMERLGLPVPDICKRIAFGVQHKAENGIDRVVGAHDEHGRE